MNDLMHEHSASMAPSTGSHGRNKLTLLPRRPRRALLLATAGCVMTSMAALSQVEDAPPSESSSQTAPLPSVTIGAPLLSTTADLTDRLAAAKAIEEAEGDFARALKEYRDVLADFDRQRVAAVDALFRSGELARRLGKTEEARMAYARVLREFTDYGNMARTSLERLNSLPPTHHAGEESRAPRTGYPGNPFQGSGFGLPSSSAYRAAPGATSRYGTRQDEVVRWAPATDLSHVRGLEQDLEAIRKEARELGAELRMVQRERRAAQDVDDFRKLNTRFVRDDRLLELLSSMDEKMRAEVPKGEEGEFAESLARQQEHIANYFLNTYLARLQHSDRFLQAEITELQEYANRLEKQIEEEVQRITSKQEARQKF
jgi:hypothetical protein